MIAFFHLASLVPVAGAPFEVAMAFDSIANGDYVGGGLGIVGGVLSAVPAAEMVGALREAAEVAGELKSAGKATSAIGKASRSTGGGGLPRPNVDFERGFLREGTSGLTTDDGRIIIAHGVEGDELTQTLRHEYVHLRIGQAVGRKVAQKVYDASQVVTFMEETAAETYATGSLWKGVGHSLTNGYLNPWRVGAGLGLDYGAYYWYTHRR